MTPSASDIPSIDRLKRKAREVARQYRKATGTDLQHARALDAVAAQYGFAGWAALVATHGAADPGHANTRKAPAVGAAAVAYPSLPALLAGREPDAPLLVTLVAAPHEPSRAGHTGPPAGTAAIADAASAPAGTASIAAGAVSTAAEAAPVPRSVAVFSDFRRGIQRYTAHRVPHAGDRDASARTRETGAFVTIDRLLAPLRLPLQVVSRQRVDAPLWLRPEPLTGPRGADAAAVRAWLPPADVPLLAAEMGWLSEAARRLQPAGGGWTFGRRDPAGRLAPVGVASGVPPGLASRQAVEAMILWYAGELGAFEPVPLAAAGVDAAGARGQDARRVPSDGRFVPSTSSRRTVP